MPQSTKPDSATSATRSAQASAGKCVGVTVVKKKRRYAMFELLEIDTEGAFLGGKLLLENGELLTLELAFDNSGTTKLDARVIRVETGERPGIQVSWKALSTADRALLAQQ